MIRAPAVKDHGNFIDDAISMFVGNKIYSGWKEITFRRDLLSIADVVDTEVVIPVGYADFFWANIIDKNTKVSIGKDQVFNGHFEGFDFSLGSRAVKIAGRSAAGDLVDCDIEKSLQYKNVTVLDVVTNICKPFGIKVRGSDAASISIKSFSVKSGENVFTSIDNLCKKHQLLAKYAMDGVLELFKVGSLRASVSLEEGVNFKNANFSVNSSARFSKYIVRSQNSLSSEIEGVATDSSIKRYRPKVVMSESSVDADGAAKRANWEAKKSLAQSQKISVNVVGWRQDGKDLWDVGLIVPFKSETFGLDTELLVASVELVNSISSGRVANLSLIPPDALDFDTKDVKEKDDLLSRVRSANAK